MNRYLDEMSRILRKLGFAIYQKDDDSVQVFHEGKQLCLLHSKDSNIFVRILIPQKEKAFWIW